MRPETRILVSEAYKLCKEMNESYKQRVTVRQIYYHLFSKGIIELTTRYYQKVVQTMTKARKRGYIPFDWIEDRSRTPLWTMLYQNLKHFLYAVKHQYKKNTWFNQENFVIVLIEKEALAQIVWDIAEKYNVFVFPTKGFSSWSMFIEDIKKLVEYFGKGKKLIVLVLSDLDPSGQYIKNDYINKFQFMFEELGFKMPDVIEKIAVTSEQVQKYNLPPMKKKYKEKIIHIWELDALDPKILRDIVKETIEKYMDLEQLYEDMQTEEKEKEVLQFLIDEMKTYSNDIGVDE
jgi:hypothetical protein